MTEKVIDSIYFHQWNRDNTLSCPHPAMLRRYGVNGECIVPASTCLQCRFGEKFPYFGGVRCIYEKKEAENGRKSG